MQRGRTIDPTQMTEEDKKILVAYIHSVKKSKFVKKGECHESPLGVFQLTHNLIKAFYMEKKLTYYVISNNADGVLGKGGSSKFRQITGLLRFDNNSVNYQADSNYGVRIKNTKRLPTYDHAEAKKDFQISKNFPHLQFDKPVKIKKVGEMGLFTKSYTPMKAFPGVSLDEACAVLYNFDENGILTLELKEILALTSAILNAYKEQIAASGRVHRDLKPENIIVFFGETPIVNFVDVDASRKMGEPDDRFGSPGYSPPELREELPTVSPARDIFSLGMIIIGCWNPYLNPQLYFDPENQATGSDIIEKTWDLILKVGSYDINADNPSPGNEIFFAVRDQINTQHEEELIDIFRKMTSVDPKKRPTIDMVIHVVDKIQFELQRNESQLSPAT